MTGRRVGLDALIAAAAADPPVRRPARRTARSSPARPRLSESAWQGRVTDLAERRGWSWLHIRPARNGPNGEGWRTAVAGPLGKGWPDVLFVRAPRLLIVEFKADDGKESVDQRRVLGVLRELVVPGGQVEVDVWRPRDWERVQRILR